MMLEHSLINQAGIVTHHRKKSHLEYHKLASSCHLLDIHPIEKLNGINGIDCYGQNNLRILLSTIFFSYS